MTADTPVVTVDALGAALATPRGGERPRPAGGCPARAGHDWLLGRRSASPQDEAQVVVGFPGGGYM